MKNYYHLYRNYTYLIDFSGVTDIAYIPNDSSFLEVPYNHSAFFIHTDSDPHFSDDLKLFLSKLETQSN